jgi:hypothetical protein
VKAGDIKGEKKMIRGDVRAVVCYFAVRELRYKGRDLGKMLYLGRSVVSVAAKRGEELLRSNFQFNHHNIT